VLLIAVVALLRASAARAAESPSAEQARRANEVRKKLAATVKFSGLDDPESTLSDALNYWSRMYDIRFEVNEQAFRDEMIDDVMSTKLGRAIPKMAQVTAETPLRRILARIPVPSGTTFVVRGGVVEITTRRYVNPHAWRRNEAAAPGEETPTPVPAPETSVAFDKRELREALQEIADATGVNIALDGRAQDLGKTPVTITLRDVAVDTAVKLLADMAGLQAVLVDEVFYVTTKENAQALRDEELNRRMAAVAPGLGGLGGIAGLGGIGGALGLGGGFGALGLGGGLGFGGGGFGGVVGGGVLPPMPRVPPPQQPAPQPQKPKKEQPQSRRDVPRKVMPAVAAGDGLVPAGAARLALAGLWARPAARTSVGTRRRRRPANLRTAADL
jgi:hypothetical protein